MEKTCKNCGTKCEFPRKVCERWTDKLIDDIFKNIDFKVPVNWEELQKSIKKEQSEKQKKADKEEEAKFSGKCVVCNRDLKPVWQTESVDWHHTRMGPAGQPLRRWVSHSFCPFCKLKYHGTPGEE